jgi:hypothetical protein
MNKESSKAKNSSRLTLSDAEKKRSQELSKKTAEELVKNLNK